MKYVIVDQIKNGDCFTTECDTVEQAVEEADRQWNSLSDHDKTRRSAFYVLESDNPDEDAENHFDGNNVKTYK